MVDGVDGSLLHAVRVVVEENGIILEHVAILYLYVEGKCVKVSKFLFPRRNAMTFAVQVHM